MTIEENSASFKPATTKGGSYINSERDRRNHRPWSGCKTSDHLFLPGHVSASMVAWALARTEPKRFALHAKAKVAGNKRKRRLKCVANPPQVARAFNVTKYGVTRSTTPTQSAVARVRSRFSEKPSRRDMQTFGQTDQFQIRHMTFPTFDFRDGGSAKGQTLLGQTNRKTNLRELQAWTLPRLPQACSDDIFPHGSVAPDSLADILRVVGVDSTCSEICFESRNKRHPSHFKRVIAEQRTNAARIRFRIRRGKV